MKCNIFIYRFLKADIRHLDSIRTAGTHPLQTVTSIRISNSSIRSTGRLMNSLYCCADQKFAFRRHFSTDPGSGNLAIQRECQTKKKKNKKESEDSGWSFDGEDYVPELTADGKAEAETVTQSAENDPKTQVRTMAPAVLSGAALVIVLEALAFGIYRKKKGRRLR